MFRPAVKVKKKLKVVVYGASGVGKSWFALLANGRKAVIDTENGTDFYGDKFEFDVFKTRKYTDVIAAIEHIEKNPDMYDVLIIDPITNIYQTLKDAAQVAAEKRAVKKRRSIEDVSLTQRDWGSIKQKYTSLISRLCNLPCHVIITGWVKDVYEGEGENRKKVGTSIDADKKTEYQPDVIIHLQTNGQGQRFGVIEKDRTMTYQKGQSVKDISFNNFLDAVTDEGAAETRLQTEEEAAEQEANGFEYVSSETIEAVKAKWLEKGFEPRKLIAQANSLYGVSDIYKLTESQGLDLLTLLTDMKANQKKGTGDDK